MLWILGIGPTLFQIAQVLVVAGFLAFRTPMYIRPGAIQASVFVLAAAILAKFGLVGIA